MMVSIAEIHSLAAPYALHALSHDDGERFERHLAECPACRTEVDEIRETAARLGAATSVVPPERMKTDVLGRIGEIRPLPPQDAPPQDAAQDSAGVRETARDLARRRWWAPLATGVAAAMTAGVIVLGVVLNDTQQELDRAQQVGTQMRQLVAARDMEMVRAEDNGSLGTVIMARSLDTAVVMANGMQPVDPDHTYQLWLITDEGVRPAGLLGHTDEGRLGPFTTHGLDGAAALGITIEPEGGSQRPSMSPLMVIELPTA